MKDSTEEFFVVLAIFGLFIALYFFSGMSRECNDRGGILVRGMIGFDCVKGLN